MALIDDVFTLCKRLSGGGWRELLLVHGLDIDPGSLRDLVRQLSKDVSGKIQRSVKGFEDFAAEGRQGIEPGSPARSLLYHAVASPNVLTGVDGRPLGVFPTAREIEQVENYVFGVRPPTLAALREKVKTKRLAVVVFACEYRPASQTCHKIHADLVFARTGIARVGTAPPRYDPARRGFLPEVDEDAFALRVLPARYVAYLAVRKSADAKARRPISRQDGDEKRHFWTPVHKLFPGSECLHGMTLELRFVAQHVNEKIRRVHLAAGVANPPETPPFVFTNGIAELANDPDLASGTLAPVPHPRLVEPATDSTGRFVTYQVPPTADGRFSSFEPNQPNDGVSFPEYVHARTEVLPDGSFRDLNADPKHPVRTRVAQGGYQALNYVDFSGDGWVGVECPQLAGVEGVEGVEEAPWPAYSLVTAPDFFPTCDQRELTEWTSSNAVPQSLREQIWNVAPTPLSDMRFPANLQLHLPHNPFDPAEDTISALVPLWGQLPQPRSFPAVADALRHSHLPDDAAGVFAPGWDCTQDITSAGIKHLAAYGLGSPFPEDAKLCAALSTFWPAVAPDATREMEPATGHQSGTVSPLTDQEIGQIGDLPWDGVPGPRLVEVGGLRFAEYASFDHVDYVRNALDRKFTLRLTARVDSTEYERRVMALAYTYLALGAERTGNHQTPISLVNKKSPQGMIIGERRFWKLFSFQAVIRGSPELEQAQAEAGAVLTGPVYRLTLFPVQVDANGQPGDGPVLAAPDFRKRWIPISKEFVVFVDPSRIPAAAPGLPPEVVVLLREDTAPRWRRGTVLV